MLISHETPISMLDVSRYYNDYDYCLVHLLPEFELYKDFYFNSIKQGRRVLLDNSIFELGEAYDPVKFARWVEELRPTEYIIPDSLEDTQATIKSFEDFKRNFGDLPSRSIGVVQGKNFNEIVECYKFMSERVDKIAISFDYSYYLSLQDDPVYQAIKDVAKKAYKISDDDINNKWCRYALGRVTTLHKLHYNNILNYNKPHHLLGCSVPWEFSALYLLRCNSLVNCIETIDTSNPIVAGILHKHYNNDNGLIEKWSCKLVDYINADISLDQKHIIQHNISKFRTLCHKIV